MQPPLFQWLKGVQLYKIINEQCKKAHVPKYHKSFAWSYNRCMIKGEDVVKTNGIRFYAEM